MKLRVLGIPTATHARLRDGGPDANGQPAAVRVAEGLANPCRHCLGLIAPGQEKLVLAYRPFDGLHPYAETGPVFLHASACEHYDRARVPAWFDHLEPALVRGYGEDHWIRYDTGRVVPGREIARHCEEILGDPTVAYVHVRSKFNCFQCRVERG
jgi:hypothetical protein